jgi:hypothetical protein
MPKSRLRGGAKAHRERVRKWKVRRQNEFNRVRNKVQKEMMEELEKMKEAQTDIVEVESTDNEKEGVK